MDGTKRDDDSNGAEHGSVLSGAKPVPTHRAGAPNGTRFWSRVQPVDALLGFAFAVLIVLGCIRGIDATTASMIGACLAAILGRATKK